MACLLSSELFISSGLCCRKPPPERLSAPLLLPLLLCLQFYFGSVSAVQILLPVRRFVTSVLPRIPLENSRLKLGLQIAQAELMKVDKTNFFSHQFIALISASPGHCARGCTSRKRKAVTSPKELSLKLPVYWYCISVLNRIS